ncbi:MAG TPA: hypothetical protein VGG69_07635 [Rhizomicrobium sp.]
MPRSRLTAGAILASVLLPSAALACACGCAIFDVGTSTLLPSGPGGTVFLEWDYLNQTKNWHGTSSAPKANNDDKNIRSNFYLAGGQYMFNERWGAMVEVPYTDRHFVTADSGAPEAFNHSALGDVRLMGVYSGFSPDMSTGVIFGVKLPTGDSTYKNFDPDVEIGSGSTDLLLGAYHTGAFDIAGDFQWFVQGVWQHHIATQHNYTPGSELNGAAGVTYTNWHLSPTVSVAPVFQVMLSNRGRDGGIGDPENTGYTRVLASPGISLSVNAWKLYADVELPVWQHVNGDQLIAPVAVKLIASYNF